MKSTLKPPETNSGKKATTPPKSQSQKQRFIETAKKLAVDESGKSFEKAFARMVPPKPQNKKFGH